MDTALVLGVFIVVGAVFGYVFHLISQMRTQQSKEVELLKEQINALESQSPLRVTEDLDRRIQLTESELDRMREDNRMLSTRLGQNREEVLRLVDELKKEDLPALWESFETFKKANKQLSEELDGRQKIFFEFQVDIAKIFCCPYCAALYLSVERNKITYECGCSIKGDGEEISPCPNKAEGQEKWGDQEEWDSFWIDRAKENLDQIGIKLRL